MKTRFNILALFVFLGMMVLSACGAAATQAPAAPAAQEAFVMEQPAAAVESAGQAEAAKDASAPPADLSSVPVYSTSVSPDVNTQNDAYATSHMIIKNGDIKLLVEDTDISIDRATQAIGDMGGYIISSRVWYQPYADGENYKYATITIGVPVDQFERTLTRLRGLAVKVLDETASGEDVTNQFVDLQSQVTNLEATRDRIKSFLDDAQTTDEALRINAELTNVEAQIEQIKGQMNYLQDRSAYSTITVNLEPVLPELKETPTPTPTPNVWKPGQTFENAKKAVTTAYQGIIDFLIWVFVVLVPIIAPPVLIIWLLWKFFTRKSKKPGQ
jgi:NACalpha-BTF3-like transcription factor